MSAAHGERVEGVLVLAGPDASVEDIPAGEWCVVAQTGAAGIERVTVAYCDEAFVRVTPIMGMGVEALFRAVADAKRRAR